jgi:hypothetical protein
MLPCERLLRNKLAPAQAGVWRINLVNPARHSLARRIAATAWRFPLRRSPSQRRVTETSPAGGSVPPSTSLRACPEPVEGTASVAFFSTDYPTLPGTLAKAKKPAKSVLCSAPPYCIALPRTVEAAQSTVIHGEIPFLTTLAFLFYFYVV